MYSQIRIWMRRASSVSASMAFSLSSPLISPFTPNRYSLSTPGFFLSKTSFRKYALSPLRPTATLHRIFATIPSPEVKNKHAILTDLHKSTFDQGTKRLESIVAAILVFVQIASPLPLGLAAWSSWSISPAEAVLYSPDTKVPRTGELALRRAIPANSNMKAIQDSLEDISYLLRIPQRKPYGTMEGNVKKALKIVMDDKESILASIPADFKEKGSELYASLIDGQGGLRTLLDCIKDKDPDKVSVGLASSLDTVAQLELLQAPGLSFLLPQQYLKYPRLTGRGMVEFAVEKGDGSMFSPEAGGEPRKIATIQVVIDGYSAPLTAGNFAKLVVDGAYNGVKVSCTEQAILSKSSLGNNSGYSVPLEIKPSGQFEPLYRTTLSVQ
ncbi:peptidyl-prolyl cis-trans isomerase CYP37, chloroplastic isoform X2 [Diospyros lotus]|nr:peptidyl-prolyl cis-trans isomerase CYP37, chloroplastic isoform X2 [Diospyros lotus]